MKNLLTTLCILFLVATTVKAESWYESWYTWYYPTNPTRQEVCDYLNDKLKGHFDSQFEAQAQAIKKKYPKVTSCQTTVWTVSIDSNDTSGSGPNPVNTIFDLADQAVNDIYFPKENLKEVPVHRDFSCFLAHGQFNETVSDGDADAVIKLSLVANQVDPNAPFIATLGDPKTGSQRDTSGWTYAIGYRKDWHEELPINPTRQEVCDYINDKLQAHFDSQFEAQAQAIKDKYPNVTRCETILQEDFCNDCMSGSSYQYPANTIFDLADQAVNDLYNQKNNLDGTPAHRTYSSLVDRDSMAGSFFGSPDDSGASIKFSPAANQSDITSVPVTAILGDPQTGSQRDTYGWRYAIGYLDDWHEELAINPTRQEVCDYLNDKLKGRFDSQFEAQAQAIKEKYPNVTRCETISCQDFKPLYNGMYFGYSSGSSINQTIFDLADQVVSDLYHPSNLGGTPVHCIYSCLIEHNPKFSNVFGEVDESNASIQFSPAVGEDSTLGVPVTAILSDPKTGQQRDTYGWTYAIEYQENNK